MNVPIKAFVRIKPLDGDLEHTDNTISVPGKGDYVFDKVFGPDSTTEEIFSELKHSFGREIEYDISVLAYGQTGSGKTFTMLGENGKNGLVHLILGKIGYPCSISFIEIYNEKIIDLIDNKEKILRELNRKVYVQDSRTLKLQNKEDFNRIYEEIVKNRKTGETNLNAHSSRSHLIIRIETGNKTVNLVDLAGSENNKKTGNQGLRMEESANINTSLFVLSKVVNSIISPPKIGEVRIPYRDSKLTRLLQDSIGGQGKCYVIATVVDSISAELFNTLNFAVKSKKVTNVLKKNNPMRIANTFYDSLHKNTFKVDLIKKEELKDAFLTKNKSEDQNKANFSPKSNTTQKASVVLRAKKDRDSSSSSFINKSTVEMTPVTKKKSYDCFMTKAKELEGLGQLKDALETYKTIKKFASSDSVDNKIISLQKALKKEPEKFTAFKVLEILNSGSFLDIKKLHGIGDKRAQDILDFRAGNHFFESIEDLNMLFNERVVKNIMESVVSD